jgi:hypothetical protein
VKDFLSQANSIIYGSSDPYSTHSPSQAPASSAIAMEINVYFTGNFELDPEALSFENRRKAKGSSRWRSIDVRSVGPFYFYPKSRLSYMRQWAPISTKRLRAIAGEFEYRIRARHEYYERVARESELVRLEDGIRDGRVQV